MKNIYAIPFPKRVGNRLQTLLMTAAILLFSMGISHAQNYCTPIYTTGCTYGDQITNVSLTGESESFDNDSECSDNAYGDYTDLTPPDLAPGDTYALSVSTDYSGPTVEQVRAWIDFNGDGQFTDDEKIADTNGDGLIGGTQTFDFTLPEDLDAGNHRMRVRLVYDSSVPTFDACSDESYGETEDYTVEIIQLEECQGTPMAGTPDDDFSVCAGNAFTLSVDGASGPATGLDRNWQSSPTGEEDWTNIDGATSNTIVKNGITDPTDFRYKVTCTNSGETDISDVVTVSLNPGNECYCTPTYANACESHDRISNVSLTGESETINNDSQCSDNAYGDYTDLTPPDLAPGETYTLSVSTDAGSPAYDEVRAWIDYNQDGQFSDDEEIANSNGDGLIGGTQTFDFTVTEGLDVDNYRMRVRLVYVSSTPTFDACSDESDGETEDYTVEIIELENCDGTPTAGTIDDDDFSICAGTAFSLSASGASDPANGLERIWQSSPAGDDVWTDIDGATSNTYIAEDGIEEPTDFRNKVTCTNSDEIDISDVVTISLNPGNECYCIPEGGASDNTSDIVNFTLADLNNSSTTGTSTTAPGYSDYTETVDPAELTPGQSYEASIEYGPGLGSHGAAIWIDYNDDGLFHFSEKVATLTNISSNGTISFPEFTVLDFPGIHRLRVQYTFDEHGEDMDPCDISSQFSETEDYMVYVAPSCQSPTDLAVDVLNTTIEVSWTENGTATEWKLIYGAPNFDPETEGTTVTVGENPATISDLDPNTEYEIYVIAICSDENLSDPSTSETFTTDELSVDNPIFENFTFYPNPVKSQLTLKAGTQIENVNVYNLLGQNVLSSHPNTLQTQLDTERLQSGIYLMEVTINGNTNIFRVVKE